LLPQLRLFLLGRFGSAPVLLFFTRLIGHVPVDYPVGFFSLLTPCLFPFADISLANVFLRSFYFGLRASFLYFFCPSRLILMSKKELADRSLLYFSLRSMFPFLFLFSCAVYTMLYCCVLSCWGWTPTISLCLNFSFPACQGMSLIAFSYMINTF